MAMTAASLGEIALTADALLMPATKNTYLTNGHNWNRANLPCYLPGNGALLLAVAHIVRLDGFKKSWNIQFNGFAR